MEIRKGDKVKFLNESGGGIVTRLIDNRNVIVLIDEGFEIPVNVDQLIKTDVAIESKQVKNEEISQVVDKINPDKSRKQNSEKIINHFKEIAQPKFAILAELKSTASEEKLFKLYLLNDGDYDLYYVISFEFENKLNLLEKGDLEPDTVVNIGTYTSKQLLSYQAIIIDILFYSDSEYKQQLPLHFKLNLNTLNLSLPSNFIENEYFDEPAYIIDLLDKSMQKTSAVQGKKLKTEELLTTKPDNKSAAMNEGTEEVDLHIEEIVDNEAKLSNGEILNIQMARFETALEGALKGRTRKIVFIHGVGNGKLRYELRKALDTKYPDLQYQDASFAEYGYGATMVIIKK
jgi:Domain of unknown function (DUF2027)